MADDLVADGLAALEAREWGVARSLLEQAVADGSGVAPSPEALDGLADARWWGGDVAAAIEARELAVGRWRAVGDVDRAVRGAVWIAIEYVDALGHEAASDGWMARARTLAEGTATGASGWIALGRAALAADPSEQAESAACALDAARAVGDAELEVLALARLGWARVAAGQLDAGITVFDEAMATATAADFEHISALGDLCCQLARATEAAGERGRFASWLEVVRRVNSEQGYPPLAAFCATCCAELHSVDGNWQAAEEHLRLGIDRLQGTGHRARCGPPVAKLAELLVLQGRLEEAAEVLGADDTDSTLVARARLALGRGEPDIARALAERWIRRRGEGLLAVSALSVLGRAAIADHDRAARDAAVDRIATIASVSGNRRAAGSAALLEGEAALDIGDRGSAAAAFERALDHYAGLDGLRRAAPSPGMPSPITVAVGGGFELEPDGRQVGTEPANRRCVTPAEAFEPSKRVVTVEHGRASLPPPAGHAHAHPCLGLQVADVTGVTAVLGDHPPGGPHDVHADDRPSSHAAASADALDQHVARR